MNGLVINNDGFVIESGGFSVCDTDAQNIGGVLEMTPGHAGNDPYLGVRIGEFRNASGSHRVLNRLKRRIKLNLKRDGVEAIKTELKEFPTINIGGKYE